MRAQHSRIWRMHIEPYRVRTGSMASDESCGRNGAFIFPNGLRAVCSDGGLQGEPPWEHVSVSWPDRCPTWPEMHSLKCLFWADDECVVQYHPPQDDYVNCHPFCLHLWRPIGVELPRPPAELVGPRSNT